MKLTILGSSGSVSGPENPASGYLISVDNSPAVIMDLGPGVLGELQKVQDPVEAHVYSPTCMPTTAWIFPP